MSDKHSAFSIQRSAIAKLSAILLFLSFVGNSQATCDITVHLAANNTAIIPTAGIEQDGLITVTCTAAGDPYCIRWRGSNNKIPYTSAGGKIIEANLYKDAARSVAYTLNYNISSGNAPSTTFTVPLYNKFTSLLGDSYACVDATGGKATCYSDTYAGDKGTAYFLIDNDATTCSTGFNRTLDATSDVVLADTCEFRNSPSMSINYPGTDTNGEFSTTVLCGRDSAYTMTVDGGLYVSGELRRASNAGNYLTYRLYSDAGRTQEITVTSNTVVTGSGTPSGNETKTVYASVKQADNPSPQTGNHTDTLRVTISF